MNIFLNNRKAKFPFNNRGELAPGEVPPETPPVTPPETPPATPPAIPKSKDEWDKLAQEDPQRWINLTQSRMDQVVRQSREAQEKLNQEQEKANNLSAELENLKAGQIKPEPLPFDGAKPFSRENMPQSKDQWDQLWIEDPNLAADLRNFKFAYEQDIEKRQQETQSEFAKTRKEAAQTIWDRHPDMYLQETDESGNVKLDGKGKPVLKIDPNIGGPMLNLESEKGKLFIEVYTEDPQGYDGAKFGPRLAMAEMERRLQERGSQQIQNSDTGQTGAGETLTPDQRGTMPGGVTPPVTGKVSFTSDEEKAHANKAVERGIYKNLEEYCQLRDGKSAGIEESGRVPSFQK